MKKETRRHFIRILQMLVNDKFGARAKSADIEKVCVAAVTLFPFLKVTPSSIGGIVSVLMNVSSYVQYSMCFFFNFQDALYNTKNSTGFLYLRIKNQRKKAGVSAPNDSVQIPHELTDEDKERFLILFKTCVLPKDIDILKDALGKTIKYRLELSKNGEYQKIFPFYTVRPDLVTIKLFILPQITY